MGFRHGLFTVHAKPEVSSFPFTDYKFKYLTLRLKNAPFSSGHRAYLHYMNYSSTLSGHSGRKFWK